MKLISPKIKSINLKLKFLQIYKKKKKFLKMHQLKNKNQIKNKKTFFFLFLIPKTFFFNFKLSFFQILKEIQQTTNITILPFKKGFNNNILKYYFNLNLYTYINNKNKMIILYNLNLTNINFISFILNYYSYLNTNFYLLYSFYNKTIISSNLYTYFYHYLNKEKKNNVNFKIELLIKNCIIQIKKKFNQLLHYFFFLFFNFYFFFIQYILYLFQQINLCFIFKNKL